MLGERLGEPGQHAGPPAIEKPSEAMQTIARADFEAWKARQIDAVQAAKVSRARNTGESGAPGLWSGYSARFLACMVSSDWTRSRGGKPL